MQRAIDGVPPLSARDVVIDVHELDSSVTRGPINERAVGEAHPSQVGEKPVDPRRGRLSVVLGLDAFEPMDIAAVSLQSANPLEEHPEVAAPFGERGDGIGGDDDARHGAVPPSS